jgi:hypothetical protein
MLTRVAKGGEVIQQSGAGRGRHRGPPFSRAGSYFRYSSDCPDNVAASPVPVGARHSEKASVSAEPARGLDGLKVRNVEFTNRLQCLGSGAVL